MDRFKGLDEVLHTTTTYMRGRLLQFFIPTSWLPESRRVHRSQMESTEGDRIITTKKLFGRVEDGPGRDLSGAERAMLRYDSAKREYQAMVGAWSWAVRDRRGMRAIRAEHVQSFIASVDACREKLDEAMRQVRVYWDQILKQQEEDLGPDFNWNDYRYAQNNVSIGQPRFFDLQASGILPNEVMIKQIEVLEQETRGVVSSAIYDAVTPVIAGLQAMIKKLTGCSTIHPPSNSPFVYMQGGEVIQLSVYDGFSKDPPPGHVKIKVKYPFEHQHASSGSTKTETITIPEEVYNSFNPTPSEHEGKIPNDLRETIQSHLEILKPASELHPKLAEVLKQATDCISGDSPVAQTASITSRLAEAADNLNEIRVKSGRFASNRVVG